METVECEVFCYNKEEFERDIMTWFNPFPAKNLKEIIDIELDKKPKSFRQQVYRRMLNYKNNKNWWIDRDVTLFQKEQEREELLAIWKFGIETAKDFYLSCFKETHQTVSDDKTEIQRAIDSWFYKTLADFDLKLEAEEINEQQYITRCDNMKHDKIQTENLLSACVCSAIGRQNRGIIQGSNEPIDMFRIICMPCGFLG
jgi:hypothetical protein